jgi:predicted DNA-binding protein (MmcQ/YjbR family)
MCCPESEVWAIKGPDNKHSPVAVVRVEGLGLGPSKAVRKANANLIAAAPDLLEALEQARAWIDKASYMNRAEWQSVRDAAQVAITKATGADQ